MDEYINRKALGIGKCNPEVFVDKGYANGWNAAIEIIQSTPATDVRPVVLCRDCKRYGGRPWENNETGICARTDCGVREDDFCSYGEKQEES